MTNNPGYRMDVQRNVLETITDDPPYFVFEAFDDFYGQKPLEIIDTASEILIPDQQTLEDLTKRQAFVAGSLAVLIAFGESDCSSERIEAVRSNFLKLTEADALELDKHGGTGTIIDKKYQNGICSHAEIKDHLDFIAEYYVETTQNAMYGQFVYIGGGFCAYELDRCYEAVVDAEVSEWIGQDISDINWIKLLESDN